MIVEILVCLGAIFGFILLVTLIVEGSSLALDYAVLLEEKAVKLSFKNLMNYYTIAPTKWFFDERTIYYNTTDTDINLSFIDYIKYRAFLKKQNKKEKRKITNKETITFLEAVQKDIDQFKVKSQKEQNEAINNITRIIHGYDGSWRIE